MAISNVDLLKNKFTEQQPVPTAPNQRDITFTQIAAPVLPDRPTMRSGQSMADHLGVKYDYDYTHGLFQDAVEKKYANLETEARRTQDMYYDSVANSANMLMGAMRRGDRDAVASGTSSGSKAAQEMSALLGISAEAGAGATELAQARGDLVYKRESELADVAKDALKYYNDLGISLGQLSASELNALVTAYAAEVATIGGIYNTDVLAGVEQDRIASTEWIADQDRFSRDNIAYWANLTNKEVAHIQGAYGLDAEEIRRQAQIQAANISAGATRYAADKNYAASTYRDPANDPEIANLFAQASKYENAKKGTKEYEYYQDLMKLIAQKTGTGAAYDARFTTQPASAGSNINSIRYGGASGGGPISGMAGNYSPGNIRQYQDLYKARQADLISGAAPRGR